MSKFKNLKRNKLIPKIENKKIAYSVLNWGMGHLTRSISIIKGLAAKNDLTFYGNQEQIEFLKNEGIEVNFKEFPDYNLNFSGKSFLVEMIFNSPRMIQAIQIENTKIEEEQLSEYFDLIISDNRFGFRSTTAKSIIITHQLNIKSPLFEKQGSKLNQIYLNKFSEVWVPDYEDHRFSGDLSKASLNVPIKFLGNISDLKHKVSKKELDFFVIGSGPEPYRSSFIEKIIDHFRTKNLKVLITGVSSDFDINDNIQVRKIMSRNEIQSNINKAKRVISKAGYTSLLDLEKMQSKAILIPTPKQYEQEYLAKYLEDHPQFAFINENEISTIE